VHRTDSWSARVTNILDGHGDRLKSIAMQNTTSVNGALTIQADTLHTRTTQTGLTRFALMSSLSDDSSLALDTGITGHGWAMLGDNEFFADFRFKNVYSTVSTSDTDGSFCIYDAGSGVAIRNRTGSTRNARIVVNY
jgi:hypothetical protein